MKAEEGVTGGTRRPGLYQDDTRSACFPRELLSPQAAPGQECPGQMGRSRRRHGLRQEGQAGTLVPGP